MKILSVFGTRPEAIKMAPVVKKLQETFLKSEIKICVTGQHREMLDSVLNDFKIKADYDLDIMSKNQDLFDVTSNVLLGMKKILELSQPDIILVHGDTSTSFASALAAFYKGTPVGHIEAGLRTYNFRNPWPEEFNRRAIASLANFHYAPTEASKKNLLDEKISNKKIVVTGNTVIDALYMALDYLESSNDLKIKVEDELNQRKLDTAVIQNWINKTRKLVLITGHRRESFGSGFNNICQAILELSSQNPEVDFLYPVHLNPNVRDAIKNVFGKDVFKNGKKNKNVYFCDPLSYFPFIYMMKLSHIVMTDSGGIQEEAPSLSKPVVLLRETTERPEAVAAGTVKIVGTDKSKIKKTVQELLDDIKVYKKMSLSLNPYGDGHASERIVQHLKCLAKK